MARAQSLCLGSARFEVAASWTTAAASGTARVKQLTADTGYLSFFDPSNVEAVVKVIDGCALNHRLWVFAGGLTDVATAISVRDSLSGITRTYTNPQGKAFQPIQTPAPSPPASDPSPSARALPGREPLSLVP